MKYLTLIRAIALLHQHQRRHPARRARRRRCCDYIEVTPDDIAMANRLAHEVLGRSLDELPPQTRRLLHLIHAHVSERAEKEGVAVEDLRFTRREVREATGWSDLQVKKHMQRLTDLEYLLVHRGGRGESLVYELIYQGEGADGEPFLLGLSDLNALGYDGEKEPLNANPEPSKSPQRAAKAPPSGIGENGAKPHGTRASANPDKKASKIAPRSQKSRPSYRGHRSGESTPSLAALGKA